MGSRADILGLGFPPLRFLHYYLSQAVLGCYFCNFEENRCGIIGNQYKMITFVAQTNNGGQNMELQTVKTGKERLIASGASMDGISIRRTGIAKVMWRKLDVDVPKSEVIANGVNIYKG